MDFTITQDEVLPVLDATLSNVDLSGDVAVKVSFGRAGAVPVEERACEIVSAENNLVRYSWQAGDTAVPGDYSGVFRVDYPSLGQMSVPARRFTFRVAAKVGFNNLEEFYEPLRVLLGDLNEDVKMYSDAVLLAGLKMVLRMGKVSGYSVATNGSGVDPAVTDPNDFALICYHTVHEFIRPKVASYRYSTRGLSESFGHAREFLEDIKNELHKLENGEMFVSWQSWHTYVEGVSGVPIGRLLTQVDVTAPWRTVHLTESGVTVS